VEILVLHPGALGDIILSLPAIAALKTRFPAAGICIAANLDHLAPLAREYADRMVSLSTVPLHQLYSPADLFNPDESFWKSFDWIISWTGAGNSDFEHNLRRINPHAIVAQWRPGPDDPRHVSRIFIDSLWSAGVPPATSPDEAPVISLDPAARLEAVRWLNERGWDERESLIAIHPGAGSKSKRWPLERFCELARILALQTNNRILLVEGPAEPGLITRGFLGFDPILARSISLALLAAVLERCRAFIGNDSGIAHLAAGLGVPSLVLFGPTLPRHWAPLGPTVFTLHHPLGCAACSRNSGEHTCLLNISVEDVIRELPKVGVRS
jgi:heptosyltransferase III